MSRLAEHMRADDHVAGGPTASIVLVEYGDYECPYCARAYYEMVEVLRRAGEHVRYVSRHFPLTRLHPRAVLAAQAAEAAGAQGRFWPMHSMLFENQGALDAPHLLAYAEELGLDVKRFEHELRAGTHVHKVQRDLRSGLRSGVSGTPTFFLDGARIDRGWSAAEIIAAIRRATRQAAAPPSGHEAQR